MSGAGVGGVWGPWWGACHTPPQPTVLFSSSRLFAVPSPLSVASALEGPTAERLQKGEGQPLLLGGPRAPHSVTSPHLLHTNKTLTRVPSRLPRAGVQCPLRPPHRVWPGLCVCRDASWRDPGVGGPHTIRGTGLGAGGGGGGGAQGLCWEDQGKRRVPVCVPLIPAPPPQWTWALSAAVGWPCASTVGRIAGRPQGSLKRQSRRASQAAPALRLLSPGPSTSAGSGFSPAHPPGQTRFLKTVAFEVRPCLDLCLRLALSGLRTHLLRDVAWCPPGLQTGHSSEPPGATTWH